MINAIINFSEAHEESQRLSRVLRRDVEVQAVNCDCDYSKLCLRCAGSGTFYQLVFAFCSHLVKDGEEDECEINYCREQEHARAELDRDETFARVGASVKSCAQIQSEREADAA